MSNRGSLPPALLALPRGPIGFCGSRRLPPGARSLVPALVSSVLAAGRPVAVGCCVGVDALVLSAALSAPASAPWPPARVFAAFGASGRGALSLSAVSLVRRAAQRGVRVNWWAGGDADVAPGPRLAGRTRALVAAASGLVAIVSGPDSRGSWLAVHLAVARGIPVVVFGPHPLPAVGAGSWSAAAGSGPWAAGRVWLPPARLPGL